jgi:hypothetical protein
MTLRHTKRALAVGVLSMAGAMGGCRLDHSLGDEAASNDNLETAASHDAGMEAFVADVNDASASGVGYAKSSQAKVALVWYPLGFEAAGLSPIQTGCGEDAGVLSPYAYSVVQNINVPVASNIVLTDAMLPRPPQQALAPAPDGLAGSWGAAQLVMYRDLNGNGTLDMRGPDEPSVDEVFASSSEVLNQFYNAAIDESYVIYYADVDIDSVGPAVKRGYNLFRDGHNGFGFMERSTVPLDTPIPMPFKQDVATRTLDCQLFCFTPSPMECPLTAADLPTDGEGTCVPSQGDIAGSYQWTRNVCDNCRCESAACSYSLADAKSAASCLLVQ